MTVGELIEELNAYRIDLEVGYPTGHPCADLDFWKENVYADFNGLYIKDTKLVEVIDSETKEERRVIFLS